MGMRMLGFPAAAYTEWSVAEDAVSYDRASTEGGFAQFSASGPGRLAADEVLDTTLKVDSSEYGRINGFVRSLTQTPSAWTISADAPFWELNVELTMNPYSHQMENMVKYFFGCVWNKWPGKDFKVFVDKAIKDQYYYFGGGKGNVWAMLKQLLSANDLSISWIFDTILVYPNRSTTVRTMGLDQDSTVQYEDSGEKAKSIECYVYNYEYIRDWKSSTEATTLKGRFGTTEFVGKIHPLPDQLSENDKASDDNPVISVNAGETAEVELQLNVSVMRLEQPQHVYQLESKTPDMSKYPLGCYCVVGKDNKPITIAQWKAEGGSVRVEPTDDPTRVKVIVRGMDNERLSPYRLAESDGVNDYPALYLVGGGYRIQYSKLTLYTGADSGGDPVIIDNPQIDTAAKAYEAMAYAAIGAGAKTITLEWSGSNPMRQTFTDFSLGFSPKPYTLGDVQAFTGVPLHEKATEKWPPGTMVAKINSDMKAYKAKELVNDRAQTFGRLAGSRTFFAGRWWHITNAQYGEGTVKLQAEGDMRLGDIMSLYGKHVQQFPLKAGIKLGALNLKEKV